MSMVKILQNVERDIARRTIDALLAAGFEVSVNNGEEVTVRLSRDADAILAAMMTTDEDHLLADRPEGHQEHEDDRPWGWVRFIYGNDGWDVINDYSVNLEDVLKPVNDYSDSLS